MTAVDSCTVATVPGRRKSVAGANGRRRGGCFGFDLVLDWLYLMVKVVAS